MEPFERRLFSSVKSQVFEKEYAIITGPRQCGKTTLLSQVESWLLKEGHPVHSLSMEDPRLRSSSNLHPENIFDFIPRPDGEKIFLLLDEIQHLDDPTNFLKLLYDKYADKLKIIVTGSSAFYLDRKFSDSLAGRKRIFELYTLDFEEFLLFRQNDADLVTELKSIRSSPTYISYKRQEIETLFREYLTYGGYPAVVLAESPERKLNILNDLLGSYVKRDIDESRLQDEEKFFKLMTLLSHQTGSQLNVHELSRTLKLSVTAVENYLYVLQKCLHIHLLKPFSKNVRKELTRTPKVYFNDLGMRNILINLFTSPADRLDKDELIENYLFIRLRQLYGSDSLHYWRTTDGHEVDFVITESYDRGFAIESKFNILAFNPSRYKRFTENYKTYPLFCRAFEGNNNTDNLLGL